MADERTACIEPVQDASALESTLLRATFELAGVGLAHIAPDGRFLRANPAMGRLVGCEPEALRGMMYHDLSPRTACAEGDMRPVWEVLHGERDTYRADIPFVRPDGSTVWTEVDVTRVPAEDQNEAHFLLVAVDVSERKAAEERLQVSERRYRAVFENANENIVVYRIVRDDRGEVVDLVVEDANPAESLQSGRSREEEIGLSLRDVYRTPMMRRYFEMAEDVVRRGEPTKFEVYFEPRDLYLIASVYPLGDDLWAAAATDITEVRRAQRELERSDAAIRQAYVDVVNIVTGGRLVLLTPAELRERLGDPVGEPTCIREPAELSPCRHLFRDTLRRTFPWLDEQDVIPAFGEAITNAVKHAGEGEFSLYRADGAAQVLVRDKGPGIDFRDVPKATLLPGFSTTNTLGLGFDIMLRLARRVLLATERGCTMVVLEYVRDGEPHDREPHHGDIASVD